ncbi:visual pigment-like receptor peropsin [Hoplias malabaricus]|uniref:visual pigment-like receptor peropsin n=1 Tax=Hoplias malabaricus TaxID=27720 RepID=UPI00346370C8
MDIRLTLKHPVKIIPWRNNNFSLVEKEAPLSEQAEVFVGVYLLALGLLSWLGNSIVVLVLYRQRLVLQPTDLLTLNLAISDIGIAMFGYSRGIVEIFNIFRDDGYVIKWIWTCQVNGFLTLLFGLASMNTLTVIGVTRYIKGCHSNKVYCITKNTISISIICIWTGALFWSMVPLLGWASYRDRGYGTCEVDWSKANYSTIYKSFIFSVLTSCYVIPVLVMLFSFGSIINTLKSRNTMSADSYFSERQRKVDRDVTKVSIAISTAFTLAWSPYVVVSMRSAWGMPVPSMTSIFARLLAKSACFYNPFIYIVLSSKFRKDAANLLPCSHDTREVVRLQQFKHLKYKAESVPSCPQQGDVNITKLEVQVDDKDSGVISPLHTPPPISKVFHVSLQNQNKSSGLPEFENDKL